jgi:dihydroorotase
VACSTINASRAFQVFRDRGTLNVGTPADIAVLQLKEGKFDFVDNFGGSRSGRERLFPNITLLGGKQVANRV